VVFSRQFHALLKFVGWWAIPWGLAGAALALVRWALGRRPERSPAPPFSNGRSRSRSPERSSLLVADATEIVLVRLGAPLAVDRRLLPDTTAHL
jgi:hypothetical protein